MQSNPSLSPLFPFRQPLIKSPIYIHTISNSKTIQQLKKNGNFQDSCKFNSIFPSNNNRSGAGELQPRRRHQLGRREPRPNRRWGPWPTPLPRPIIRLGFPVQELLLVREIRHDDQAHPGTLGRHRHHVLCNLISSIL